jgi:PKD repeat protein
MKKILFTFIASVAFAALVVGQVPRSMVCVEIETSTLCTYCPGAAMGAEDMLSNGDLVAVIENHCNGLGTDPYSNVGARSRETLWAITGYPTATFDGVSAFVGGSNTQSMYTYYAPKYNARIATASPIQMNMTFTNTGLHYDFTITVIKVGTVSAASVKLFLFVTESNIAYNWEGQHKLHFVNRNMVPDQNGTTVDFTSGDTQTFNLSTDLASAWDITNCEFVATVQDMDASQGSVSGVHKREQYQTVKSGVIPLTVDFAANNDTINPNQSVQFTNNTSGGYINVPETFDWLFPGAIPPESNDTNPMVIYQAPGNYDVTLIVNKGGQIDTLTKSGFIYVNHGLGINQQASNQITVSPNPGNGTFKLTFNTGKSLIADISIMNAAGTTVYSESNVTISKDAAKTIITHGLPAGEYFLYVTSGDTRLVKKILIN